MLSRAQPHTLACVARACLLVTGLDEGGITRQRSVRGVKAQASLDYEEHVHQA